MTWFTEHAREVFKELLIPRFAGKPTRYLEIGVWRGDSLVWMLEHILNHPESHAYAIDPWLPLFKKYDADKLKSNYKWCIERLGERRSKCTIVRSLSSAWLRTNQLPIHSLDLVLIDGEHFGPGVLDDFVLTWPLVKDGGWIIIDDFRDNDIRENCLRDTVAAITGTAYKPYLREIYRGWQIIFEKTGDVLLSNKRSDDGDRIYGIQTVWPTSA